jgi:hypothetical protein
MSAFIGGSYSLWLLILGPVVFVLGVGPWVDNHFPVVDPFVVVRAEVEDGHVELEGWMKKVRDCKTVEVYALIYTAEGIPRVADIEFKDRIKPTLVSHPVGTQFWGPWRVYVPAYAERITLRTRHSCHPLWDTISESTLYEASHEQKLP